MSRRRHRMNQALRIPSRGIWMVTLLIIVGGVAVLLLALPGSARRQASRAQQIELGDDSARVTALLGARRARCPVGGLEHLARQFPPGWPPAEVEAAIERLRRETRDRWLYPPDRRTAPSCDPEQTLSEVGLDAAGHVLWLVPVRGRTPILIAPQER